MHILIISFPWGYRFMNILSTARFFLRPYQSSDGDAVWQVISRPEIYATTNAIPKDFPRQRVEWWFAFLENTRRNGTGFEFGVFERETGAYLGNCGLVNVNPRQYSGVLTYFIHPQWWGRGVATEASAAVLDFAFGTLGLVRVGGSCMACNPASRRVMEKLGFQWEGTGRRELYKDGIFHDVHHLSLLAEEWGR